MPSNTRQNDIHMRLVAPSQGTPVIQFGASLLQTYPLKEALLVLDYTDIRITHTGKYSYLCLVNRMLRDGITSTQLHERLCAYNKTLNAFNESL